MKDFEGRLEKLETLAERIRQPDLPLEEAVSVFEEGIKLSRGLRKDLDRIQQRVEILINEPGEGIEPEAAPFGD